MEAPDSILVPTDGVALRTLVLSGGRAGAEPCRRPRAVDGHAGHHPATSRARLSVTG